MAQNSQTTLPLHLIFFLLTLLMFVGFSWYSNYEPIMESIMDQVKMVLMVSPLLLLLVVHFLSNYGDGGVFSSLIPLPERDSLHRAGGTPWGVGLFLVLLLFMVSYQSSFQERWFPLLSRWTGVWGYETLFVIIVRKVSSHGFFRRDLTCFDVFYFDHVLVFNLM